MSFRTSKQHSGPFQVLAGSLLELSFDGSIAMSVETIAFQSQSKVSTGVASLKCSDRDLPKSGCLSQTLKEMPEIRTVTLRTLPIAHAGTNPISLTKLSPFGCVHPDVYI